MHTEDIKIQIAPERWNIKMHIETMSRASLKSNSYGGLPWHTKAVLLRIKFTTAKIWKLKNWKTQKCSDENFRHERNSSALH